MDCKHGLTISECLTCNAESDKNDELSASLRNLREKLRRILATVVCPQCRKSYPTPIEMRQIRTDKRNFLGQKIVIPCEDSSHYVMDKLLKDM